MKTKNRYIILILFVSALIFRKTGMGFSHVLLMITAMLLVISLIPGIFRNRETRLLNIILVSFTILAMMEQFHVIESRTAMIICFICFIIWAITSYRKISANIFILMHGILICFLLGTAALMNPRQHHNFYRQNTYESFIRARYSEGLTSLADLYVDRYKSTDAGKAHFYLQRALLADSLSEDENASYLYDKSIDYDPDNSYAYYRRGFFKLTHLELDNELAYSAIKDFNRAISLKPEMSKAYFHRGVALMYLDKKARACLDFVKAKELDGSLDLKEFIEKTCMQHLKESAVPLNP
jgi:hypothetical protein